MNKELQETGSKEVMTATEGAWGSENIDKSDILVPKILLGQAISKAVVEQEIGLGQFYDSLDMNVLANYNAKDPSKTENLKVIVFSNFKTWVVSERAKGKKTAEYRSTEIYGPENSNWKYEEELADGSTIVRDLVQNCYCLLVKELEEDLESAFPYVLPFKRTSARAGKKMMTTIQKLAAKRKPAAAKVFELTRTLQDHNESGGKYFVVDVKVARDATKEEMGAAYQWYLTLNDANTNVKVDDSDEQPQNTPDAGQSETQAETKVDTENCDY